MADCRFIDGGHLQFPAASFFFLPKRHRRYLWRAIEDRGVRLFATRRRAEAGPERNSVSVTLGLGEVSEEDTEEGRKPQKRQDARRKARHIEGEGT